MLKKSALITKFLQNHKNSIQRYTKLYNKSTIFENYLPPVNYRFQQSKKIRTFPQLHSDTTVCTL